MIEECFLTCCPHVTAANIFLGCILTSFLLKS